MGDGSVVAVGEGAVVEATAGGGSVGFEGVGDGLTGVQEAKTRMMLAVKKKILRTVIYL